MKFCPHCGVALGDKPRSKCAVCEGSLSQSRPIIENAKTVTRSMWTQDLTWTQVLVILVMAAAALALFSGKFDNTMTPTKTRQVVYSVSGEENMSASLTYQNESGGTEQRTVPLPWSKSFLAAPGSLAYISAQKQSKPGSIVVIVSGDGKIIQRAESTSEFGIAVAGGVVP